MRHKIERGGTEGERGWVRERVGEKVLTGREEIRTRTNHLIVDS